MNKLWIARALFFFTGLFFVSLSAHTATCRGEKLDADLHCEKLHADDNCKNYYDAVYGVQCANKVIERYRTIEGDLYQSGNHCIASHRCTPPKKRKQRAR